MRYASKADSRSFFYFI